MRRSWAVLTTLVLGAGLAATPTVGASGASAAVLPGTSSSAPTTAAVGAAATAGCADVAFVAAPGNGAAASSLGALQAVFDSARAAAPDRTFAAVRVARATQRATVLRGRGTLRTAADRAVTPSSVARWAGDVPAYAAAVDARLRAQLQACPEQLVLLAGHAQGAMALHRVLATMPSDNAAAHRRVVGAALVSDGYRARGAALGAPAARSTGSGVNAGRSAPAAVPTSAQRYPVPSVCTRGDLVCDLGPTTMRRAVAAHAYSSRAGRALLRGVGADLGRSAARAVLPAPVAVAPLVRGVQAERQIGLRVLAADRDDVVVTATSALPPGLQLSAEGTLAGVPSRSGSWTVGWSARNAAAPWAPAASGSVAIAVGEPTAADDAGPVSAGAQHGCLVRAGGELRCWGSDEHGQLGTGAAGTVATSPVVVATGTTWRQVSAGGGSTCGVRTDRTLWCWGLNHKGQLGIGTTADKAVPTRVGTATDWDTVSVDWFHACATTTAGRAFCWGDNSAGQVGDGTETRRLVPTPVAGTAGWRSVQAGGWHTCGVRQDGTAACWGRNDFGELGTGTTRKALVPAAVAGRDWRSIAVSWAGSCGLRTTGAVACWGRGDQGQVGDGARSHRSTPRTVAVPAASAVSVGDAHACALDRSGIAWCWGTSDRGALGAGRTTAAVTPVSTGRRLASLDAGWMSTCGTTSAGALTCWGENSAGQLGDGTRTDSATRPATAAVATSGAPLAFNLATFNLLGHNHTAPRLGDDHFAPAWIRAQWSVQAWRQRDLSVIGTQETDPGQIEALTRAAGGEYAVWPGLERGRANSSTALWWRTSEWQAVTRSTITIPFMSFKREIPVVQLRSRQSPTRTIWVMALHNSPGAGGQAKRNQALAIEKPEIQRMLATGDPVYVVGDFNQQSAFCELAPLGLASPRGGSAVGGACTPPAGRLRVDWLFGSTGSWSQYAETRDELLARITDHHLVSGRVTLR